MPEAILTILKFCFLALLYLFLARIVRVVYLEMGGRSTGGGVVVPVSGGRVRNRRAKATRLRVVAPSDQKGRIYDVGDELTLGRATSCQISLPDDHFVSQLHARVYMRDGEVYVEDLGSTNGTYLNRQRLTHAMPVTKGDRIQVGKTVLELSK
ncbi:MAG TPA: FHA domain-containing protein [Acidimicrobiia bacterium]|nr:FHA domain-containing protein [Acidimicrobiia bacterium]